MIQKIFLKCLLCQRPFQLLEILRRQQIQEDSQAIFPEVTPTSAGCEVGWKGFGEEDPQPNGSMRHQKTYLIQWEGRMKNWTQWSNNDQAKMPYYLWFLCQKQFWRELLFSASGRKLVGSETSPLVRPLPSSAPTLLLPAFPSPSIRSLSYLFLFIYFALLFLPKQISPSGVDSWNNLFLWSPHFGTLTVEDLPGSLFPNSGPGHWLLAPQLMDSTSFLCPHPLPDYILLIIYILVQVFFSHG